MTSNRLDTIGIKQIIRIEWLERAASLLLSGVSNKEIRYELHEYLAHRRGDGENEMRGETARSQIVNIIMNVWVTPAPELINFRNAGLELLKSFGAGYLPVHWSLISAAYPFWFNVAKQVGRLLNLQSQIQKQQIDKRLQEQYGERETINRNGRQVVRSFIAWNILIDENSPGCYSSGDKIFVTDIGVCTFLFESVLHCLPLKQIDLQTLLSNPSLFPFALPKITPQSIPKYNLRIELHGNIGIGESICLK